MQLKENNKLKLISFLIAILLFLSVMRISRTSQFSEVIRTIMLLRGLVIFHLKLIMIEINYMW